MYCVKCGVEHHESTKECPLCGTTVYYPEKKDVPAPYPEYVDNRETVSKRGIYFIITFAFLIAASISVICDLNLGASVQWSGYVIGGLLLAYEIFILPGWFTRPSATIFIPCHFASIAAYLLYICFATGGEWYLTLALPVVGALALITSTVYVLCHYVRRGYLYISGGTCVAIGLLSVMIEMLIDITFGIHHTLFWSPYPLAAFVLIGVMLFVIAIVKPFREAMKKKLAL